jgi:putative copper resistance protein D
MEFPDALSLALRAVSFVLLLGAAGTPIFQALFGRLLSDSAAPISRSGWWFAVGALVFVIGHQLLEGARMAGEMGGVAAPEMQLAALRTSAGWAFALQVVGLVLIAARPAGLTGTALALAAFTLTGHTSTTPNRLAGAALLVLHLLTVAFWLGSLWPLYIAATRETPATAAQLIDAFSRKAVWLVPIILLAGVGLAVLLVPDLATFQRPYGQLLLAKVAGFTILMALAAGNKWRFGPECAQGRTARFKRAVVAEYIVICIVLAITATLTMFFSPEAP